MTKGLKCVRLASDLLFLIGIAVAFDVVLVAAALVIVSLTFEMSIRIEGIQPVPAGSWNRELPSERCARCGLSGDDGPVFVEIDL